MRVSERHLPQFGSAAMALLSGTGGRHGGGFAVHDEKRGNITDSGSDSNGA
jgi:hypothetical protein